MNIFTVSFFGHRQLDEAFVIEKKLEGLIRELLVTRDYIVFLVGRNGEFDQLVASTIRRCKRAVCDDSSELVLVLPYITAEYKENADAFHEYYDAVEICEASIEKHYKAAYKARNDSMVDRSDLIVFCVQRPYGGAYQTMRYASRAGAAYINLPEHDRSSQQHPADIAAQK